MKDLLGILVILCLSDAAAKGIQVEIDMPDLPIVTGSKKMTETKGCGDVLGRYKLLWLFSHSAQVLHLPQCCWMEIET